MTNRDVVLALLLTAGFVMPLIGPRYKQLDPRWWTVGALFTMAAGVWAI
jgi:hypothetical protein